MKRQICKVLAHPNPVSTIPMFDVGCPSSVARPSRGHPCQSAALFMLVAVAWCGAIFAADPPVQEAHLAHMHRFMTEEARRLDATFLGGVNSPAEWQARRGELRAQYLEMLGLWPLPERTPLKTEVTGVLERPEGYRVEKVHFQSRPRLYVTANLYLPRGAKPGAHLPAVLYVCGHSGRGRDGNKAAFQHHGAWFATHGYACLVVDTLQLGEIAAIHHGTYRYNRWWWQARGYTPAAVECWNGIRALDYLQSRPEVDGERLAVTGISGGGAATFWIAAADERVKVAVPVSGMSDLEDYVGGKIVNGHCDCMFMINTFQWSWAQIAALVAPRPLLFANSGHDTIFPMDGNDRLRASLERLYGLFTNRTDRLFDMAVAPGGHEDKPELRLMAYRWINMHLKNDAGPVTEPPVSVIDGPALRAFPGELPADEINTRIDEFFVPAAASNLPANAAEFESWREAKLSALRRIVFRSLTAPLISQEPLPLAARARTGGRLRTADGMELPWTHIPAPRAGGRQRLWLVVLEGEEVPTNKPDWVERLAGDAPVLLFAPRGHGATRWNDPAPFFVQRSLPLLGRTVDTCRLDDVLAMVARAHATGAKSRSALHLAGRGQAGVLAAYAALLHPGVAEVSVFDPPVSHQQGPIFLNVLRVLDIPEAFGLLVPRRLTLLTSQPDAFERTARIARAGGGQCVIEPLR